MAVHYNQSEGPALALCQELEALGVKAIPVGGDLQDEEAVRAVFQQAWDGLDEATRQAVLDAAAAAEEAGWARARELADWYKEQLAANGMTVEPPGEQLEAGFQAIGATMTEEWLAVAGDAGKAIVDAYKAGN